jgi:FKBP-type peptidyl-prolyl cis-trans isomerase FklB
MKTAVCSLALTLLALGCALQAEDAPKTDAPKEKDIVSYAIGVNIGRNMLQQGLDGELDPAALGKGLAAGLNNTKPTYSDEEMANALKNLQTRMMTKHQDAQKGVADKNKKEGEAFLAENGKKEGVKTTASGLQYKVIKEGDGAMPKLTDTVKTHYKGTLLDGTEFDSSYARNEPATFPLNGVIKGWTEVLQLMKVGSKYQVYIPSSLAYGENGAGDKIGPNSTLIFDIELLNIEDGK